MAWQGTPEYKSFLSTKPGLDQMTKQAEREWQEVEFLKSVGSKHVGDHTRDLQDLLGRIEGAGGSWAAPNRELTDDERESLRRWYAGAGPEAAAQADLEERAAGRQKARDAYDRIHTRVEGTGLYPKVLAWAKSQLANPQAIDDVTQRRIEAGIEHGAAGASRDFERRLRESAGARGLPGMPGLSGYGIRQLGGFESGLNAGVRGEVADSRVTQALANRDYERMMNQFAMEVMGNDPISMLERERASLEAGLPFMGAGMGFGNYASLLSAIDAQKQAQKQFGQSQITGALSALLGAGSRLGSAAILADAD